MAENSTRTTTNSAASPRATAAAQAALRALNPEQQAIVQRVLAANRSLSLDEALAQLKAAGL